MSNIQTLVNALSVAQSRGGKIVASTDTTYSIATKSGIVVAPRSAGDTYAVGDSIKVTPDGVILGKVRSISSLPVYYV